MARAGGAAQRYLSGGQTRRCKEEKEKEKKHQNFEGMVKFDM